MFRALLLAAWAAVVNCVLIGMPNTVNVTLFESTLDVISDVVQDTVSVVQISTDADFYSAAANSSFDFFYLGPAQYVCVAVQYNVMPIATPGLYVNGVPSRYLGGAIAVLRDSPIQTLHDLIGKRVAIVQVSYLSGCQAQWFEMRKIGLDLFVDCPVVYVTGSNDLALAAVLTGDADAAFVSPGSIRTFSMNNAISSGKQLRYTALMPNMSYPAATSTVLYPDGVLASAAHISWDVRNNISQQLLAMPDNSSSYVSSWNVPAEYFTVAALQISLGVIQQRFQWHDGMLASGRSSGFDYMCSRI